MTWVERQTLFKMGILQNQMEKIGLKIKSVAEYFQNVAHEKTNKYLEIIENRFPMPYNRTKSTVLYFRWVIINLYLNLCHFLKKKFFKRYQLYFRYEFPTSVWFYRFFAWVWLVCLLYTAPWVLTMAAISWYRIIHNSNHTIIWNCWVSARGAIKLPLEHLTSNCIISTL